MNNTDAMYGAAPKRFRMPLCDRIITAEVSNDYTLPDYQPEIRRILRVGASILPPAKYIEGNSVEFNGTIDYHMLYIGADGGLYTAPLSAEYSFNAPLDITNDFDLNEGVTVLTDISDESITSRVTAPRKLSIKCRLASRVRAYGMMIAEERCSGEVNPLSIERLDGECDTTVMMSGLGEIAEFSEEIFPESGDMRVISASAEVNIPDVTAAEGYADCRGNVTLKLLVCREGETASAETLTKNIPFSEQVEIDELTPDSSCRASAYISDITVSVEDGRILCDLSIIPEVTAHKSVPMTYTRDLYSTENYCEASYRDYVIPRVLSSASGNFSQSERISVSDTTVQHGSRIVDIWCKPYAEKVECDKNKYILSGQCRYTLLLEREGDYSVAELAFPFKYECDGGAGEPTDFAADIGVISCRGRLDGGNIGINTELSVAAEFMGSNTITALSEARFGEMVEKSDGDIIICYPAPDDTPWSISKKYFVPASKISAMSDYIVINN